MVAAAECNAANGIALAAPGVQLPRLDNLGSRPCCFHRSPTIPPIFQPLWPPAHAPLAPLQAFLQAFHQPFHQAYHKLTTSPANHPSNRMLTQNEISRIGPGSTLFRLVYEMMAALATFGVLKSCRYTKGRHEQHGVYTHHWTVRLSATKPNRSRPLVAH